MAYLMQISDTGTFKEIPLKKKITTLGPSEEADLYCPSLKNKNVFFQIVERDKNFQILGLTPHSYILHQGEKKQKIELASYDFFEIQNSKFIFSKKPFQLQPETPNTLAHYQTFYRFSLSLSEANQPVAVFEKLLDLILEISKANKGFLLSFNPREELKIIAAKAMEEKLIKNSLEDLSKTLIQQVKDTLSPVIIDNISEHQIFKSTETIFRLGLLSVACFPLLVHKKLVGFLYLGSTSAEGLFNPLSVQIIQTLLSQASLILENALLVEKLEKEKTDLKAQLENTTIIGASTAIEELFKKIEKIAPLDLSVLILGETGTGKEMVAREIHRRSARAKKPFVAINCGAIPENLLESALFGHKKGSFTGAIEDKIGKFEAADKGIIFLDEIAEMPFQLQVKLLRVLQEKVIERVGDVKEIPIDVRIIASTHQNLEEMIKQGSFREDLYYRLNEIYLQVPPLRERQGDILLLAQYFLEKHKKSLGYVQKRLSKEAQEKLLNYPWPGNIRELENIIKRTLVFSDQDEILPEQIEIKSALKILQPLKDAKNYFQKDYIKKIISLHNGDKISAAKALGVSVRTIFRILN